MNTLLLKIFVQFWQITAGLFISDKDEHLVGRALQIISRFTWELPQSLAGFLYNQLANIFGKVSKVEYYGGATVVKGAAIKGGAVSLGSFISISNSGHNNGNDILVKSGAYTFMHEYGHYLQSRKNGFAYLFKYGLPSLWKAEWTEWDANQRAAKYFKKKEAFTWNPNYYKPGTYLHRYSQLPKNGKPIDASLIEFLLLPLLPFLNKKKPF